MTLFYSPVGDQLMARAQYLPTGANTDIILHPGKPSLSGEFGWFGSLWADYASLSSGLVSNLAVNTSFITTNISTFYVPTNANIVGFSVLETNSTTPILQVAGGLVGVKKSPAYTLDVAGTVNATSVQASGIRGTSYVVADTSAYVGFNANGTPKLETGSGNWLRISSTNYVAINSPNIFVTNTISASNMVATATGTTPAFKSSATNNFILKAADGGTWILRVGNDGTLTTVTNAGGL